jgi:hypothetical protein
MNVEIGAEATQFPEKEYINGIAGAVCLKAWSIYEDRIILYTIQNDQQILAWSNVVPWVSEEWWRECQQSRPDSAGERTGEHSLHYSRAL